MPAGPPYGNKNAEKWNVQNEWKKESKQDSIVTINKKIIKDRAIKRLIKNNEIHYVKAKALTDLCILPKKNEQYRIITEKQFNAYALILAILQNNTIIDEMILAIYRINEPTVISIIDFIEASKIKKAWFIISNFFNQTKIPEQWAIKLKDYADKNKNVKHAYVHNHSKIIGLKVNENYYVFEGSGNMSDNARIEQYLFENNKQSYDFHFEWITKLTK